MNVELIKRFLEYNNIQVEPSHKINERAAQSDQELYEIFRNSISYNNNPSNRILKRKNNGFRVKRDEASNKEELVKKSDSLKPIDNHKDEDVDRDPPSHSAIGVTLVLGFVFMLIIDQIGGKVSHRHLPSEWQIFSIKMSKFELYFVFLIKKTMSQMAKQLEIK